jgi:hypothetical protein
LIFGCRVGYDAEMGTFDGGGTMPDARRP